MSHQQENPLVRKTKCWPDPELSIGDYIALLQGRECWKAVGPARQAFDEVTPQIKAHLDKLDSIPRSSWVTWSIYMIGRSAKTARPTVMFFCEERQSRIEAWKAIKNSRVLEKYPGIRTGHAAFPPEFECLDHLATSDGKGNAASSLAYNHSIRIYGRKIVIGFADDGPGFPRVASVGGIVTSQGNKFILSAGRVFLKPHCRRVARSHDNDCQVDSDEDDDYATAAGALDVGTASKYRLSPDDGQSTFDRTLGAGRGPSGGDKLSTASSSANSLRPTTTVEEHVVLGLSGLGGPLSAITATLGGDSPCDLGRLVHVSVELDYALIEVPNTFEGHTFVGAWDDGQTSLQSPSHVFKESPKDVRIIAQLGSVGVVEGKLSRTPSFTRFRGSRSFQKVFSVQFNGPLWGDGGVWVVDADSYGLCGHVVAGCEQTKTAYIVPAVATFENIATFLGSEPSLNLALSTELEEFEDITQSLRQGGCNLEVGSRHTSTQREEQEVSFGMSNKTAEHFELSYPSTSTAPSLNLNIMFGINSPHQPAPYTPLPLITGPGSEFWGGSYKSKTSNDYVQKQQSCAYTRKIMACKLCRKRKVNCDYGIPCRPCVKYFGNTPCRGVELDDVALDIMRYNAFPRGQWERFIPDGFCLSESETVHRIYLSLGFGQPFRCPVRLVRFVGFGGCLSTLLHRHVEYPWPPALGQSMKERSDHVFPAVLVISSKDKLRRDIDCYLSGLLLEGFKFFPLWSSQLEVLKLIYAYYLKLPADSRAPLEQALKLLMLIHTGGDVCVKPEANSLSIIRHYVGNIKLDKVTPCFIRAQLGPIFAGMSHRYMRIALMELEKLSQTEDATKFPMIISTYSVLLMGMESLEYHTSKLPYHMHYDRPHPAWEPQTRNLGYMDNHCLIGFYKATKCCARLETLGTASGGFGGNEFIAGVSCDTETAEFLFCLHCTILAARPYLIKKRQTVVVSGTDMTAFFDRLLSRMYLSEP